MTVPAVVSGTGACAWPPRGRCAARRPIPIVGRASLGLLLALGFAAASAQPGDGAGDAEAPAASPAREGSEQQLPTVSVTGHRDAVRALPPTESTTIVDSAEIERTRSANVFEIVREVPGVSVDGGPRATGMKFNIRGFRGNEDVLFKIDGAVKGFEKYRFGSGVFIEPELIKSVTVERGPSILTGSGAVGGAVIATTKSAADLLAPGERIGALLKLGYDANNHERLRMASVYGRPTQRTDLLVSLTRRDSQDYKLAGGERFPATANSSEGSLIKLGWFPTDALMLELSRTAFDSGPTYTPFDANSSNAFVGGYVHQNVDDETINLRFTYQPVGVPWLKLRGALAHETTDLRNQMRIGPGESTFTIPCTATPCVWSPYGGPTGQINDFWDYRIRTAEVFNDTSYRLGPVDGTLTVGAQAIHNRRDLRRLTENPLMNGPDGRYPSGFDEQQPPGTKIAYGLVAQNAFKWSDLTFTPGVRWDRYRMEADGQARIDRDAAGVPASYGFSRTTPNVTLSWQPGGSSWYLTHRWARSFRPPLITDYFGMNAASPCSGFFRPDGTPLAPNGCGDLLEPTRSTNREYTVAWLPRAAENGALSQVRLTYYQIDTTSLVGASYLMAREGMIVQPYDERRRGVELEANYTTRRWYAQFDFSRILARRTNTLDGESQGFTAGIPGTTTGLMFGYRAIPDVLEFGYRVRHHHDQVVLPGATSLTASTQYCGKVDERGVVQAATTLQDLFATWKIHRRVTLNAAINNLFDKRWCNNGDELGNVIGLQGPGRSARVSMTVQF